MSSPDLLTEDEVRRILKEAAELRDRVEAEWASGKRDGLRLGLFGVADALPALVRALEAGDVDAFSRALKDLGMARMTLSAHCGAWRRAQIAARAKQAGEREGQ